MTVVEFDPRRFKITSEAEAEVLVRETIEALDVLEPLIENETALFKAGKVREALAFAMDKNAAAQRYTRGLENLRHNAIAIGRFQPQSLDALRARHDAFSRLMTLNLAVVSTTRTVSEGLVRELATAVSDTRGPKTYTREPGRRNKAATAPLLISKFI